MSVCLSVCMRVSLSVLPSSLSVCLFESRRLAQGRNEEKLGGDFRREKEKEREEIYKMQICRPLWGEILLSQNSV